MNRKLNLTILIIAVFLVTVFLGVANAQTSPNNSTNSEQLTTTNQCVWSRKYPVSSRNSQPKVEVDIAKFQYPYTYYMNSTEIGAAGLFTVFDAHLLRKGEFRIGGAITRFYRYPSIRITQIPISFTCGVFQNLEFFFSTDVRQEVRVNSPQFLSGGLLASALSAGNFQANNLVNGNTVNNGFFLLPGLPVSGALSGSVLPGLPRGTPRQVFDPILNRFKNVYEHASFPNNMPFLARSGSNYGETIVGAKFFNISLAENQRTSFLAYAKFPSKGIGDVLSNPNNALYTGASAGKTDFGFFILNSVYIVKDDNQTTSEVIGDSSTSKKIKKTYLNIHSNIGYLYNRDPTFNGVKLVDRKNELVVGTGVDSLFKVVRFPLQFILENRTVVPLGGGTLDVARKLSSDFTVGFRLFPRLSKEIPQRSDKEKKVLSCDEKAEEEKKKKKKQFFWSLGAGYRYTLGVPDNLSDLARSNHGFVFQFNVGRVGKNFTDRDIDRRCPCKVDEEDEQISITNVEVSSEGDVIGGQRQVAVVFNDAINAIAFQGILDDKEKGGGTFVYQLKADGESYSSNQDIKDYKLEDNKIIFSIPTNLILGREYKIKVIAELIKENTRCPVGEKEGSFINSNNALTAEIEPKNIRVSAQRPETNEIMAKINGGVAPFTYKWNIPNEITGIENGTKLTVRTEPARIQAGQSYSVSLMISDNNKQTKTTNSTDIVVNNPPTVELKLSQDEVRLGDKIELIAEANDADGDELTYIWRVENKNGTVVQTWESQQSVQVFDTSSLEIGEVYTIRVTVTDKLDEASNIKTFVTIMPGPSVYFNFDEDKLSPVKLSQLDEVADLLKRNPEITLFIRIQGNTDFIGTNKYNDCLGCRRACRVRNYLIAKGVKNRIETVISFGESAAIGRTSEQRRLDRRVDLVFVPDLGKTPIVGDKYVECNCQRTPPGSKCKR